MQKFKKEVKGMKDYVALVTISAGKYQKTNLEILKYLVNEEKNPGVYVTLNKPFDTVQRILKENGIDERMIIFIDAVTHLQGDSNKRVPRCLFIGSPEKLSDISLAMDQAIKSLSTHERFIFFDSLNTLTLYNQPATVARFIHFLTSKMREWKIKGIILTLRKEADEELLNDLTPFCDIRIDGG